MDGAQDSLPVVSELPDQSGNRPGSLAVETRSWLVEEQQDFRLRRELYSYRQALSLFDVET